MTGRRVTSGDVQLAVRELGDPSAPTVVLLHGYPDTSAVWDGVAAKLCESFHVVAYDTRGTGASSAPASRAGYAMDALVGDLAAVIDAVSPDRPVHLAGHDWGSVQGWGAVTGERLGSGRVASFTSMSGPCIDHLAAWARERLRHPSPRGLAQLAGQARRSWYIGFFQVPAVPELVWRAGLARHWPALLRRLEGVPPGPDHPAPTLARDAVNGVALYRANMLSQRRGPRGSGTPRTDVPVQLVVPTKDAYVSPALYDGVERWAPRLWRRDVRARHWLPRSHPELVARCIAELVDHMAGSPPTHALRRAQVSPVPAA